MNPTDIGYWGLAYSVRGVLTEACVNRFLSSYWSDEGHGQTQLPQKSLYKRQINQVETLGSTTQETTGRADRVVTERPGGNRVSFSSCPVSLFLFSKSVNTSHANASSQTFDKFMCHVFIVLCVTRYTVRNKFRIS